MEREHQPEWTYPWQEDAEGHYINLRTDNGIFELRPFNTYIFVSTLPQHEQLTHVYRITEEDEDSYNGFYLWRRTFAKVDKDMDMFIKELEAHGFEVVEFDEPELGDVRAWEKEHGIKYEPNYPKVPSEDELVAEALKDFEHKWNWYSGEWND